MLKLRLLFIIIITGLFFQFLFTLLIQEPYPAIKYPSFNTIYDNQAFIEIIKPEVSVHFAGGKSVIVDNSELFRDLPESFISPAFDTIELKTNVAAESRRFTIGAYTYEINKLPVMSDEEYQAYVEWMRKQTIEATGIEEPHSLTIDYYQYRVFMNERPIRQERQLINSVLIDFEQGG